MSKKLYNFARNQKKRLRSKYPNFYYFILSDLFIQKNLFREKIKKYGKELEGLVLDLGCGRKPYKNLIKHRKYFGVEYNQSCHPDIVADGTTLPFRTEVFDSIFCTEVIEHVREPEVLIKEIDRVLKFDGRLLISAPMSWNLHYEPDDFFRFTKYGMTYLLEKNRFRVIAMERVGGAFSLGGQRMLEAMYNAVSRKLTFMPNILKLIILQFFISIPLTLLFFILSRLLDGIDQSDAIGWVTLAIKSKVKKTND